MSFYKKLTSLENKLLAEGVLLAVVIMGPFVAIGILLIWTLIDLIVGLF